MPPQSFYGTLIHSLTPTTLEYLPAILLIIDADGRIAALHRSVSAADIPSLLAASHYTPTTCPTTILRATEFLIPGFIDTHTHAPQWAQRGVGRGVPLLTWLSDITFANEARCADATYARDLFSSCIRGGLQQGITTACYYSSRHAAATIELAQACLTHGQRALVGKCNMDRNATPWYQDASAGSSVAETQSVIETVQRLDAGTGLVTPVITPRFAISCTGELLSGLGALAAQHAVPVQTHFNESAGEVEFTRRLFPEFADETALYDAFGLLGRRSILAHAIYVSETEMARVQALGCGIAHCPVANTTMDAFMVAPVRAYLRRGMKVGLGTDCGGGYSSSMLETMRAAFVVSVARASATAGDDEPLSVAEGFYLATRGGAQVCGLEDRVGWFAEGMEFDACVVRTDVDGVMAVVQEQDELATVFEKFVMTGDDRNITRVFVKGREVKG